MLMFRRPCFNRRGMTLIELVIAMAILAIMASMVLPLAEVTVTRNREIELRRALRDVRSALDLYKKIMTSGRRKENICGHRRIGLSGRTAGSGCR